MRNLVEIYNSNDLRWLLDVNVLPENYDTEYLIPVMDEIIFEDEKLTGNNFYTNFLRKSDFATKDAAKLVVLRGCYTLLQLKQEKEALHLLSQMKIKADTLDKVDREMRLLTQRLQVKAMKDEGKEIEKQNFGKMCAYISKRLDMDIRNVRISTVAEYRGFEEIIKQMNADG